MYADEVGTGVKGFSYIMAMVARPPHLSEKGVVSSFCSRKNIRIVSSKVCSCQGGRIARHALDPRCDAAVGRTNTHCSKSRKPRLICKAKKKRKKSHVHRLGPAAPCCLLPLCRRPTLQLYGSKEILQDRLRKTLV